MCVDSKWNIVKDGHKSCWPADVAVNGTLPGDIWWLVIIRTWKAKIVKNYIQRLVFGSVVKQIYLLAIKKMF